jgi:hypothetical protein
MFWNKASWHQRSQEISDQKPGFGIANYASSPELFFREKPINVFFSQFRLHVLYTKAYLDSTHHVQIIYRVYKISFFLANPRIASFNASAVKTYT